MLDDHGIRPPIIAAGINLFGGPLGLLHKHVTGAMPIRRNTKDPASLITLKAYVAELLQESRPPLLHRRRPQLQRRAQGAEDRPDPRGAADRLQNLVILPMAVVYDLVLEDRILARQGVKKQQRPFARELAEMMRVRGRLPFARVRDLRHAHFQSAFNPQSRKDVLELAHRTARHRPAVQGAPTALVAAAMRPSITRRDLEARSTPPRTRSRRGANLGVDNGRQAVAQGRRNLPPRDIARGGSAAGSACATGRCSATTRARSNTCCRRHRHGPPWRSQTSGRTATARRRRSSILTIFSGHRSCGGTSAPPGGGARPPSTGAENVAPGQPCRPTFLPRQRGERATAHGRRPEGRVAGRCYHLAMPSPVSAVERAGAIARAVASRRRALIVGGWVRDGCCGHALEGHRHRGVRPPRGSPRALLARFGPVNTVGESFAVYKVADLDVSLPRRESKVGRGHRGFKVEGDPCDVIEEAARRRDFTVNAIAWDPLADENLDPFGGRARPRGRRAAGGRSRTPSRTTACACCARVQFAARFGSRWTRARATSAARSPLDDLAAERVWGEFEKLLLQARAALGRAGARLGTRRARALMPECLALVGCAQEPEWHPGGDVWVHTLQVVDEARRRIDDLPRPKQVAVMLARVAHDFGKPATTAFLDGRIRSLGHEEAGVAPTLRAARSSAGAHDGGLRRAPAGGRAGRRTT